MKKIIDKLKNKYFIAGIAILFLLTGIFLVLKPSKIEAIKTDILAVNTQIEEDKKAIYNIKKRYEKNIWLSRCLEKNIVLEAKGSDLENCNSGLERFASYNLKK